jgi:hypothetical protein
VQYKTPDFVINYIEKNSAIEPPTNTVEVNGYILSFENGFFRARKVKHDLCNPPFGRVEQCITETPRTLKP